MTARHNPFTGPTPIAASPASPPKRRVANKPQKPATPQPNTIANYVASLSDSVLAAMVADIVRIRAEWPDFVNGRGFRNVREAFRAWQSERGIAPSRSNSGMPAGAAGAAGADDSALEALLSMP